MIFRNAARAAARRWARLSDDLARLTESVGGMGVADLLRARRGSDMVDHRLVTFRRRALARLGELSGELLPDLPPQCDWVYRPDLFRRALDPAGAVSIASPYALVGGATLFHDCTLSEIGLRQILQDGHDTRPPFGLRLEIYRFGGSFLSLVQDLPRDGVRSSSKRDIIAVELDITMERPIRVYARLNISHGPNSDQLLREMDWQDGRMVAEFDLAYSRINERRLDKGWIDFIFDGPAMNALVLHDIIVTRVPRAEI